MINIIRGHKRHFSDFGWLKTYWLFSFSQYYDPQNISFGPLRVFNDDVVSKGTGFPTHPHQDMEIVTIVLDGEITHKDSMGNETTIIPGDVQRMSAGSGINHSEYNTGTKESHFYQIWLHPRELNQNPSYDQKHFELSQCVNILFPIASGQGLGNVVTIDTDATIYRALFEPHHQLEFQTDDSRRIFIYVTFGDLEVNGNRLAEGDQARVDLEEKVVLKAKEDTHFILIDVPSAKGLGYDINTLHGETKED